MSKVREGVPLRELNTLKLESQATYFLSASSIEEVRLGVMEAKKHDLHITALGGGSNVILSPVIEGLTLHLNIKGREVVEEGTDHIVVRLGAGESWHECVLWAHSKGYYGLENLALIPGSVGAAPVQNIGAYGVEIQDLIAGVEVVDGHCGETKTLTKDDCAFGYRDSVFKREVGRHWLIVSVDVRLSKQAVCCIEYPGLRDHMSDDPMSPESVLQAVIALRKAKLPDPLVDPNVGSFFKNPIVSQSFAKQLKATYRDMPQFTTHDNQTKLSAAWMIDYLGWRGVEENGVIVSVNHALVLINKSALYAPQITQFAGKISASVKATFDVTLEVEPQLIGSGC
ncbi:UDP-N-acetylmuramate dehydrogenase [Candidatus Paraluminiphilus aquimaris]|uniref:UDP-N-acetylenolpyruvoylglucosamine reductase n=1 Tax=Candidatus Paraluminiphilus aquimaris TaxID=2518994 RepID=A0ABY6Q812_9GAMM|nr:UDP-N-acetylmuramate dehydrogenase [Candidatus Paraluminiphilus aquimaris]UZP74812.1 UDP-N-acetylmuramate dehydrogenase [Candidatus Paraluminiphilus aquimaris]